MDEATVLVANALVSSRLDYCNYLFRSPSSFICKLQCIQKTLGRTVTKIRGTIPKTVEFRCIFKTDTLVKKFLHSGHPNYFSPHLSVHGTRYNHLNKSCLEVP